jgi:hypothetical protein
MLATSMMVLTGGLLMVAPRPAEAACPIYCSQDRIACRNACAGNAACLAACQDAYVDCCKF